MLRDLKHEPDLTPEQLDAFNRQVEQMFPGGFDRRDEANAIIAMSVRNGPIENLHAGKHSPLLEDETLSRLTDADIKTIMLYATKMVTFMLWLRDEAPEVYRRYVQVYGSRYCRMWERQR
jgi:hypothetical protein